MGLRGTLIEPVSVIAHYATLLDKHPELAFLPKVFSKMGHIDFTIGDNSEVTNWIFHTIGKFNKYRPSSNIRSSRTQTSILWNKRKLCEQSF